MIPITDYAVQNWTISPVEKPSGTVEQDWLIVLTGVAKLTLPGDLTNDWRRETVFIDPEITESMLTYAIEKYGPPRKFPHHGGEVLLGSHAFFVEQGAPFAAISSVYDKETSGTVHDGFAVDAWRLHTIGDNAPHRYAGLEVDVAVLNKTVLYRVSYQITLVGKIVYLPPPAKSGQPDPGIIP